MKITQASSYDRVTISLHWLTALIVLFQFLSAQIWDFFSKPAHHLIIVSHMSFGIVLTAVLALRLFWRATSGRRLEQGSGLLDRAAQAGHLLLYGLLVAEVVLGFLFRWSGHSPLSFFGLIVASPFAPLSRTAHALIGQTHDAVAWIIIVMALGHACAALFHHYVMRDGVLRRMLPGLPPHQD
jgi:cytochrome b561